MRHFLLRKTAFFKIAILKYFIKGATTFALFSTFLLFFSLFLCVIVAHSKSFCNFVPLEAMMHRLNFTTMTNAQKKQMHKDIEQHGQNLLAIFPNAKEQNPVKLCKKLRRLENLASNMALDLCNGIMTQHMADIEHDSIKAKVIKLLGEPSNDVFFINLDPRGYSLKLTSEFSADKNIHRDWGGFGILAPNFTPVQ